MRIIIKVNQAKLQATSDYLKRKFPLLVMQGLEKGMHSFLFHLANVIADKKLHGQVLNWRGGHLAGSIIASPQVISTPPKIIGKIGSNLVYARIHEFGGIIRAKNKPYLHFKTATGWVRTKEVHMPERSYLRSSLREELPNLATIIGQELERSLQASAG